MNALSKPSYGNWVPRSILRKCAVAAALAAAAAAALWAVVGPAAGVAPAALALFLLACLTYFACARRLFAGGVQERIRERLVEEARWDGRGSALDIGCGAGALVVGLAKRYPEARVTGVDVWAPGWEYSMNQCEENARLEGVGGRTRFVRGSAASLPFPDATFDLVVSNMVLHEVRDQRDKRALIREALRVLKPGGRFALQDPFRMRALYGDIPALVEALRKGGLKQIDYADTHDAPYIPRALRLKFMVGGIGILYGTK